MKPNMSYTALYSFICLVQSLTHKLAKVLVLVFGLQAVILYLLASVADAPLASLIIPAMRVLSAVAFLMLAPRVFNAALQRITQASQRNG
ncbi:hypothetical protein [Pseudomonas sp.]|uniref:hypothetical protein n=1 Tax=Pseudomonas sp. TaxID=306 RepID=UPI003FD72A98